MCGKLKKIPSPQLIQNSLINQLQCRIVSRKVGSIKIKCFHDTIIHVIDMGENCLGECVMRGVERGMERMKEGWGKIEREEDERPSSLDFVIKDGWVFLSCMVVVVVAEDVVYSGRGWNIRTNPR